MESTTKTKTNHHKNGQAAPAVDAAYEEWLHGDPILKMIDESTFFDVSTEEGRDRAADAQRVTAIVRSKIAPRGALGLPPLLDRRRHIVGITDGAFARQCMYDRVLVWQVPRGDGVHAKDTAIWMPDTTKDREKESAPRGIIVGAGLRALDHMRANGIDLGHVVEFSKLGPIRIPCDWLAGKDKHLCVIHAGDIVSSEDLALALQQGLCRVKAIERNVDGNMVVEHMYVDGEGKIWTPTLPWRGAEY